MRNALRFGSFLAILHLTRAQNDVKQGEPEEEDSPLNELPLNIENARGRFKDRASEIEGQSCAYNSYDLVN